MNTPATAELSAELLQQAADWFLLLRSGEAGERDHERLRAWRAAHADHERAWQRAEALAQRLDRVPPQVGVPLLDRPPRRRALRALGVLLLAGASALLVLPRPQAPQTVVAEYRTAVGERRSYTLADGTRLTLNTGSRVRSVYSDEARVLQLQRGEILVETAKDTAPAPRSLRVETAHGRIVALGTRFTVRMDEARSRVGVREGRVRIEPHDTRETRTLEPGQRSAFDRAGSEPAAPERPQDGAWTQGMLIASREPLCEFVRELARYRRETLRCDPAVAGRRISGAFPLDDPERLLTSVAAALDLRVERLSADELLVRAR